MRSVIDPAADERRRQEWLDTLPAVAATLTTPIGRAPAFVREELVPVWEWFRPYCEPGPLHGTGDSRDPLDVLEGIPAWAATPGRVAERQAFGVETLRAIDVVARFHAEVLLRAHPQARVVVYDDPEEEVDDDGDIVLLAGPLDPQASGVVFLHRDVLVQAQRATFHEGYAPEQLLKISDLRSARIAGR